MDSTSTFTFMVYTRLAHLGERQQESACGHYCGIVILFQSAPLTTDTTSPATADGAPLEQVPG